ncbi:MAG: DUF2079 domain-containing protein [Acidimicrobiales bacterium]
MTRRPLGLRRRLDNLALRVQARLDASWADRGLPWLVAAALFITLLASSLAITYQLDGGPGLGVWTQAAWHVRNGDAPFSSLAGIDPVLRQWSFVAYPVLALTRWLAAPELLAVVQALALAAAVIPLWRIARDVLSLRVGTTAALVLAYASSPAVHAANLSLFHPEVVAVPALAGAVLCSRRELWVRYWLCIGLVLVCRADLGVTVAALGVVGALTGQRRVGMTTAALGAGWTAVAILVLRPVVPSEPLSSAAAFAAEGTAPLGEIRALFVDPTVALGDLIGQPSLLILTAVLAPLLFLPFVAPRSLMLAVPPLLFGIAGNEAVQRVRDDPRPAGLLNTSNVVLASAPLVIAAAVALAQMGRRSITRVNVDHRLVGVLVVAASVLFVQNAPSSPYQKPWEWGGRDEVDDARLDAVDAVDSSVPVTVSPQFGPLVAERATVRELAVGPPDRPSRWSPATDMVLLDTNARAVDGRPLWTAGTRNAVTRALTQRGYSVAFARAGVFAFSR